MTSFQDIVTSIRERVGARGSSEIGIVTGHTFVVCTAAICFALHDASRHIATAIREGRESARDDSEPCTCGPASLGCAIHPRG